jgi:hypothetical protein
METAVSLSGTRGLIRISKNLECAMQAAMVADRVREPEFYRRVTGGDFPGEYGERQSARRRGTKFEENLHMNDAALLRRALAPQFRFDPDTAVVRNFGLELPGASTTIRAMKLHRTRRVLEDLVARRPVPAILIKPQLRLPIGPGFADFEYVEPDFMVLDPAAMVYVPGEEKSFIVREGVADASDLELTRRQAAVQIHALRAEAARLGVQDRVLDRAAFVFATPFGLLPAPAVEEFLYSEVHEIAGAVEVLRRTRTKLNALRQAIATPLEHLVDELPSRFQERCIGSCILAAWCEGNRRDRALVIGDDAVDLLGNEMAVSRAAALLAGAPPDSPREAELQRILVDAASALGHVPRSATA